MSVEEVGVIDAIGIEDASGKVVLTISDHLDWENEDEHEVVLQEKLNTYLSFIESGELLEAYPDAKGRDPVIEIVARVEPPDSALAFLEQVAEVVAGAGFELRTKLLTDVTES